MNIDAALVRELITAQFPEWADLTIHPAEFGGWDNRTFRLGEQMSVRLPSAAAYVAQVEKEHRWLPRLGPRLPLAIPMPLAMGIPARGYPWPWSIYRWLDGDNAAVGHVADAERFAIALAQFLVALQAINVTGAPPPGTHNFFRGGALTVYDRQTRDAISTLAGIIDAHRATAIWEAALETTWRRAPVWVHGDVSAANLLVSSGHLSAVIDFGCSAVGDPACDLTIAWTFFSGRSRHAFRTAVALDEATWARARGWALWKALITLAEQADSRAVAAARSRYVIDELIAEQQGVR